MALTHTDTNIENLKINKFNTLDEFEAAQAQGLIGNYDISLIPESLPIVDGRLVVSDNGSAVTTTTVEFSGGNRNYEFLQTQQDLQLSFIVENETDNYLLIESTNPTIPITITIVSADINNPDTIISPATSVQIPALGFVELSVVKVSNMIIVTSSESLVKTTSI